MPVLCWGSVTGWGERASLSLRYSHSVVNLYENIIFTDQNGEPLDDQPKLLQQSVQLLFAYHLLGN